MSVSLERAHGPMREPHPVPDSDGEQPRWVYWIRSGAVSPTAPACSGRRCGRWCSVSGCPARCRRSSGGRRCSGPWVITGPSSSPEPDSSAPSPLRALMPPRHWPRRCSRGAQTSPPPRRSCSPPRTWCHGTCRPRRPGILLLQLRLLRPLHRQPGQLRLRTRSPLTPSPAPAIRRGHGGTAGSG